jgi:hypothetical protein
LVHVFALAFVHIEPLLNVFPGRFYRHQAGGKLYVAVLADAEQGMVTHDPKFSLYHWLPFLLLRVIPQDMILKCLNQIDHPAFGSESPAVLVTG